MDFEDVTTPDAITNSSEANQEPRETEETSRHSKGTHTKIGDIQKPVPMETVQDRNQSVVEVQVQDSVAGGNISKGKLSAHKDSNLPTQKLHQPTAKIIQSMETWETIREEQPVLDKQRAVEEQPIVQGRLGGEEDGDMSKLIKCKQGTRDEKKCTDILWVGNVDEEGRFILRRDIKDYFFKYVDKGYKTILVRTTVEVPIHRVSEWVCEFLAKKVGMPEPWNTCIASKLTITFKGKVETGQDLLSIYPEKSLFLLSKGQLPDQFKNHQGKLWECTHKCGKADNKRYNIIKDKKCQHKIHFAKDQPTKTWGNSCEKGEKLMHIPLLNCGPASPPSNVSISFNIAEIVFFPSNMPAAKLNLLCFLQGGQPEASH